MLPAGSLAAAVLATGWLLTAPAPPVPVAASGPPSPAAPGDARPTLAHSRGCRRPGVLADGVAFQPLLYGDATTAVGTAPTPAGDAVRLLLPDRCGVRHLQRVAQDRQPQFLGFAVADGVLFWTELRVSTGIGQASTEIWRVPLSGSALASLLTKDAGAAVFFESQYDLVVADGRVHWVAAAPGDALVTEVRSVPVVGGPVRVDRVTGAFALSAWPWLHSAPGVGSGPMRLRRLDTGAETVVAAPPLERVVWCRSIVSGAGAATRYDLVRPDGSDRRRIGGGTPSAVLYDVALLDRFEPVSDAAGASATTLGLRLLLSDLTDGRLVLVTETTGQVLGRDGVLWWSTGDQEALVWHSLDLRTLPR
ncbi:hypothetical protein ACQP00_21380 [Dactylosporangium sp. CS-047395]|uniref:hypothetical protein n=1 Tax=Dactylosporangium sp. CS-047395 TaxID=3239936 RepID=UPI003D8A7E9C